MMANGVLIKAQEIELPQNRALRGALLKGAMAWREGRAQDANPYVGYSFLAAVFVVPGIKAGYWHRQVL